MADLQEIQRQAYEKRLQKYMDKYGDQVQERIRDVTTTSTDPGFGGFDPTTTTMRTYGHYGPTPTHTSASAIGNSTASPATMHRPEGWIARFLTWNWDVWGAEITRYTLVTVISMALTATIGIFLLSHIPEQHWILGIKRFKKTLAFPAWVLDQIVLWFWDKTFGALGRVRDRPWVHEARANRVRLWEKYKFVFCTTGLSILVGYLLLRNWDTPGCYVKIHDLPHRGFHMPEWVIEASRKQYGHQVTLLNKWHVFDAPVTTTWYDEEPVTQASTATSTVTAYQIVTSTIEFRGEPTTGPCTNVHYPIRWNEQPETLTIHETVMLKAAPVVETVTIREEAIKEPGAAPKDCTVTSDLPATNPDYGSTALSGTAGAQGQNTTIQVCSISSIYADPVTSWSILANVTPTTVQIVRPKVYYKTKTIRETVPGGTLIRTVKTPHTVTDTSTVTKTAKKVSKSTVYKGGKTTVTGGTIVMTTEVPTTITVTDTSVVPGPTCASSGVEEQHEEDAHVCENIGKRIGYCKKCQQYHCCELKS